MLSRTGSAAEALTVTVSVTETAAMLAANPPSTVAFGAGESSATLTVPTDDDGVVEAASVVTAEDRGRQTTTGWRPERLPRR